jgi:hypothetical protein
VGQGYLLRKKLGPIAPPKDPLKGDRDTEEAGGGNFLSRMTSGAMGPKQPATANATAKPTTAKATASGPPPPPPRKKKKRSGRRR